MNGRLKQIDKFTAVKHMLNGENYEIIFTDSQLIASSINLN